MLRAPFITIQGVAELLKESKATVRTWMKNDEQRAVKLEREFRFAEARASSMAPITTAVESSSRPREARPEESSIIT